MQFDSVKKDSLRLLGLTFKVLVAFCNGSLLCADLVSHGCCLSFLPCTPAPELPHLSSIYYTLQQQSTSYGLKFAQKEKRKEKKRKDCAFWCQFHEKPCTIPGCPGTQKEKAIYCCSMAAVSICHCMYQHLSLYVTASAVVYVTAHEAA